MEELDQDFINELQAAFREEAAEHIQSITSGLLNIEQQAPAAPPPETTETIYRAAHSIKGAARAVNMPQIGQICQIMESVFAEVKLGSIELAPAQFDSLHAAVETVTRLIDSPSELPAEQLSEIETALTDILSSPSPTPAPSPERSRPPRPIPTPAHHAETTTVRIDTQKLETLLLRAEQMLAAKLAAGERTLELRQVVNQFEQWKREWELTEARIPHLPGGFRQRHRRYMKAMDIGLHRAAAAMQADSSHVGSLVDDLLQETKHVLLLPISSILKPYPLMVRDIARDQGKPVVLTVNGDATAVDKRILEQLVDPLTHLLRNCIDHGIESPDVRRKQGKPERATIALSISQTGPDAVEIHIRDDGAGIDLESVIQESVRLGRLTADKAATLSRADALQLLFVSGLSTRNEVTSLSGRGLGLAIVRENVERLGGTITVDTTADHGTSFILQLPVTVSSFRAVLVRTMGAIFALPTLSVERIVREPRATIENANSTIAWNDERLCVYPLHHVLGLSADGGARKRAPDHMIVVIVGGRNAYRAFEVDSVVGEQEVLLKHLGPLLSRAPMLSGVTVLGSGEIAPVLDPSELVATTDDESIADTMGAGRQTTKSHRRILVVEDSITSRTLLRHVLEGAGYHVETAVDGVAALARMRRSPFDLTVSDIEMPRMDGLELTRQVRAEPALARMPVVLVTTLDSPEDQARGMEAGANAYLAKSRFNQENLLQTIEVLTSEVPS